MNQRMAYLRFASRVFLVLAFIAAGVSVMFSFWNVIGLGASAMVLEMAATQYGVRTSAGAPLAIVIGVTLGIFQALVAFFLPYTISRLLWYLTDLGNLLQLVNAKLDHANPALSVPSQLRHMNREHQPVVKIPAVPPLN
jgi:hypothetical protein